MKKSALFFIIVLIVLLGMHFFVYNEEFSVKTIMVSVVEVLFLHYCIGLYQNSLQKRDSVHLASFNGWGVLVG